MKGPVITRRTAIAGLAGVGSAFGASLTPALALENKSTSLLLLLLDPRQTDADTLALVQQLYGAHPYEVLKQEPVRAWRDGLADAVCHAGSTHVIGRWDMVYILSMLGREAGLRNNIKQLRRSTFSLTLTPSA